MLNEDVLIILEELGLRIDSIHYSSSVEVSVGVADTHGTRYIGKANRSGGTPDVVLIRALTDALDSFDSSWRKHVSCSIEEPFAKCV